MKQKHIGRAWEALNELDDYARMTMGVDPIGPRGVLEKFINKVAKGLKLKKARVKRPEKAIGDEGKST